MGGESAVFDRNDTLRIGLVSPILNLDPVKGQDWVSAMVIYQIYEALFSRPTADSLSTEPLLFSEPLLGAAGQVSGTFSASVRSGIRFSDGTLLTADHVVKSLRRSTVLMDQADVESEHEKVIFHLKRPNARFDIALSQDYLGVSMLKDGQLIGTGPYMVSPDATPSSMRLVRNPYHEPQPKIGQIVLTCYEPDPDGRPRKLVEAVERGDVDFTNVLDQHNLRNLPRLRKYVQVGNATAILYLNTERKSLQDRRIRQAIALSIDRVKLAAISHSTPEAFAATNLLPPSMSTWTDGIPYSIERAREMVKEVGPARPDKLTLRVIFGSRPYLRHPREFADYIAKQLGQIGIEVVIQHTNDSDDFVRESQRGDYDLMLAGWIADTEDPADFLDAHVSGEAIPTLDVPMSFHANLSRWRNPAVEAAVRKLREEPGERNQNDILELIAQDLPLIPLTVGTIVTAHSFRVEGFEPTSLGRPYLADLELRGLE